jgi:membrane-associated phospholipid phosphatase
MSLKIFLITLLITLSSAGAYCQNWNINLLKKIHVERNENLDPTFRFITKTVSPLSLGTPVSLFVAGAIRKDTNMKRQALYVAGSIVVSSVITSVLKSTIKEDRPFVTYPFITQLTVAGPKSFPSGHTAEAFTLATSLSMAYPKWYVIAPSYLWATAVGYSRMHLGVHYPGDVFAGAIIGSGSAYLTRKLSNWYFKKLDLKKNIPKV